MLTHENNRLTAQRVFSLAALAAGSLFVTPAIAQEAEQAAAAVLRGRVQNELGGQLPGVLVRVAIPAADMRFVNSRTGQAQFETISDDNGDYRLEIPGIAKPTKVSIDAMKPGYRRLCGTLMQGGDVTRPEISAGGVAEANLKLLPALYFKGIVVDEDGKPIPSVEISANANTGRASGGIERTASGPDGEFELFNYPAEPFKIQNEITKGAVHFFHPEHVGVGIGDVYAFGENERTQLRVILGTGYKISGIVRDAAGKAVSNVVVKAVSGKQSQRKAIETDANGGFELAGMPPGPAVLSVRALDIKQKIRLPLDLGSDKNELDVRLQEMLLPPDIKGVAVLGMKLTDLTPELKAAYDLGDNGGALILDPGPKSERLGIGKLAHGYNFWLVGNTDIGSVREFVERILAEAEAQNSERYSIRVVYSFSTVDFDGTNTQYLKLTKDDVTQLKAVLNELTAEPK